MKQLIDNFFFSHYGIPSIITSPFFKSISNVYFEIEDGSNKNLIFHLSKNLGVAKFENPNSLNCVIFNNDLFISSVDYNFQKGKKRCDFVLECPMASALIFCEIKDSPHTKRHRKKAKRQLLESLSLLIKEPEMKLFLESYSIKKCCYFNKKVTSPNSITATLAFNRINNVSSSGLEMPYPEIESFGFHYFECSVNHQITLQHS